jgi:Tfp pilus assembly protein PilO
MKKAKNTTQIIFVVTLVFILGSITALLGLIYLIEENSIELKERVHLISLNKAQQEERYEVERLLSETKEERENLLNFVLTEDTVIDFITNLEKLASSYGIEFNTKTISPEKTKDEMFDDLNLNFSFSGPKDDIAFLISVLETVPNHAYIKDLSVRQSEEGNTWSVNMTLVVTILEND